MKLMQVSLIYGIDINEAKRAQDLYSIAVKPYEHLSIYSKVKCSKKNDFKIISNSIFHNETRYTKIN